MTMPLTVASWPTTTLATSARSRASASRAWLLSMLSDTAIASVIVVLPH
jgi:hypothetical protein